MPSRAFVPGAPSHCKGGAMHLFYHFLVPTITSYKTPSLWRVNLPKNHIRFCKEQHCRRWPPAHIPETFLWPNVPTSR